ncbi:DUF4097 family beta strand repeat-containing protein [Granulicella sibirica]|uniref:DUF4097 domain-containing protein n=1 Tax=Granulicella sibirica TaxID=2479048 RepID=A0A4Q0T3N6_9BACT|nr:DUF4097 family beta strand repeat-containing protein [Granulicella sibirica]RXH56628.1 hypothetical protein GRAN_3485 [Granulicella sibirica]
MKIQTIALTLTLASTSAFAADRNFDRTVPTGNAPNVSVSTGSGYVHIHPGNDNQVHVTGHIHSSNGGWFSSSNDIDHRLQEIADNPPIHQNGNDLIIGERQTRDLFRNISIDYEITLPRNSILSTFTGSGDIETQDVAQSVRAETGSGSLRIRGVHGSASLHSGSGDIELEQSAQGDTKLETGSGSIRAHGVNGGLQAESGSGDIEIYGRPATDWRLQTGSGSIRLTLGNDARFNVNASTGSGSIRVQQSVSQMANNNGHHLTASVNGGGPNLRASTGSGDIEIK